MNSKTKFYHKAKLTTRIVAVASAALALTIALSYLFGLRLSFDYAIGHFERGSTLFYILTGSIIVSALLATISSVFVKKKASITILPATDGISIFISVFASVMAFVSAFSEIRSAVSDPTSSRLALFAAFGLIVVALAFFSKVVSVPSSVNISGIAFTLAALAIAMRVLQAYFDQTLTINSPVRHVVMLAELSVMFFLLSEARISFGIEKTKNGDTARRATLPFFLFTNCIAATLALGISAGALIYELIPVGTYDATVIHPSLFRLALYVMVGVFALVRLFRIGRLISEYTPSPFERVDDEEPTADETAKSAKPAETSESTKNEKE